MLTIENIHKLKGDGFITSHVLRVAGEKWELTQIQTSTDVYQFVFKCIEAQIVGGLYREAVINLYREDTMGYLQLGQRVYELKNIITNKSRLVSKPDLIAPGRLIGPILRVIEGC